MPAVVRTNATALDTAEAARPICARAVISYAIAFSSSAAGAVKAGKATTTPGMVATAAKAAELRAVPDSRAKEALAVEAARAARCITADPGVMAHRVVPLVAAEARAMWDLGVKAATPARVAPGTAATATAVVVAVAAEVTTAAAVAGVAQAASTAAPRVVVAAAARRMPSQAPLGFAPGADGTALRVTALSSSVGSDRVRFYRCAVIVCVVAFAACGGSQPPIGTSDTIRAQAPNRGPESDLIARGIYVSQNNSIIYGYRQNNRRDRRPVCTLSAGSTGDVAGDSSGNLIVPEAYSIAIFDGPGMCGPELGSFSTGWSGYAVDAASLDAAHGIVAVAAIQNGSGPGSIELCTISAGCGSYLRSNGMNIVYGVAIAKNGDCWASWEEGPSMSYAAFLTYFKGCAGSGQTAVGYKNPSAGGLSVDKGGNLVAISYASSSLYVYSGCRPKCKAIGGPFSLKGVGQYGHLNAASTRFVAADSKYGRVDVYRYQPTALTYLYSFSKGLSKSATVFGATYNR